MRKEDEKLFEAARRGDLNEVRDALRQGADPTARAERGHTPLHAAALEGHAEVVGLLIDAGADVNARTSGTKTTPLHSAAGGGHAEVARLLLEHGADPGAKTVEGIPPGPLPNAGDMPTLTSSGRWPRPRSGQRNPASPRAGPRTSPAGSNGNAGRAGTYPNTEPRQPQPLLLSARPFSIADRAPSMIFTRDAIPSPAVCFARPRYRRPLDSDAPQALTSRDPERFAMPCARPTTPGRSTQAPWISVRSTGRRARIATARCACPEASSSQRVRGR